MMIEITAFNNKLIVFTLSFRIIDAEKRSVLHRDVAIS